MERDSHDTRTASRSSAISRRQFVATVGASGLTVGLAGCSNTGSGGDGGGGDGNSGGGTSTENLEYDGEDVTVEYSTAPLFGNVADMLKETLYSAGLPESIDVKFSTTVWGADDLQSRYNQILSAGRATPDMMLTNFAYTPYFAPREWLLDLTEVFGEETMTELENNYSQVMVDSMRWDSGLYGIPQFIDIPTIQYRKDLVKEAGYDPEGENWATEPMQWNRFAKVVADTKEQAGTDDGYTVALNQRNLGSISGYEQLVTNGGNYFGDMSNQNGPIGDRPVTINEEQTIQTLRQLRTFMYGSEDEYAIEGLSGNITPSEALGWDTNPSMESFTAGEAVAHRNWSFAIADFGAEEKFGENLGVMPYPYGMSEDEAPYEGAGGSNSKLGGWHLSINPNTEHLAATVEVIKAMTTDEFYLTIFEELGSTPPKPELLGTDRAKNVDVMSRHLDTLQYQANNQFAPPINAVWSAQKSAIGEQFLACLKQQKSPKAAAKAAQDQVKQIENQES
ncbi:extracellular solute-binding protein [Haloarcula amylovorans]|uniref:extracellular solute-binding protein n=1 Tax=Haloarcula amylovorans TaxID=2562280 RepID=UPI001FD7E679|nr:extracellular solute-binding protein [Halomicroarcula amylolytica]